MAQQISQTAIAFEERRLGRRPTSVIGHHHSGTLALQQQSRRPAKPQRPASNQDDLVSQAIHCNASSCFQCGAAFPRSPRVDVGIRSNLRSGTVSRHFQEKSTLFAGSAVDLDIAVNGVAKTFADRQFDRQSTANWR